MSILGIGVDADAPLADRWRAVRDRLTGVGLEVPIEPAPDGTIISGTRPHARIGIWLMPDNRTAGRLEDFLARLIPASDACWSLAQDATRAAQGQGCRVADHLKSSIHTWLAWQDTPGLSFGTALRAELFRHDSAEALAFVRWFGRLFPAV